MHENPGCKWRHRGTEPFIGSVQTDRAVCDAKMFRCMYTRIKKEERNNAAQNRSLHLLKRDTKCICNTLAIGLVGL
jgi:hypothetical protein